MKSNNTIGTIIIIGILGVAFIKAFDIHFSIENIKNIKTIGITIVLGILIFLWLQNKNTHNQEYYKEYYNKESYQEHEENLEYKSNNYNQFTSQFKQPFQEEDNIYTSYYNQITEINSYQEEDNRWS
jgi:hypothetical protein